MEIVKDWAGNIVKVGDRCCLVQIKTIDNECCFEALEGFKILKGKNGSLKLRIEENISNFKATYFYPLSFYCEVNSDDCILAIEGVSDNEKLYLKHLMNSAVRTAKKIISNK
jgi:hypothetical protein